MSEQTRPEDDRTLPNRASNMEKAEGSRDNFTPADEAGGITNRPVPEEQQEQSEVPPRGQTAGSQGRRAGREGGHA